MLSIFIPTYKRKEQFHRLYKRLLPLVNKNIEIVIGCSSPEYIPDDREYVTVLNTENYTREENYIYGIEHCHNDYVLIAEDDDLYNTEVLERFIPDKDIGMYVYGIMNQKCGFVKKIINAEMVYKNFYDIFGDTFQWGQVITRRDILLRNMHKFWNDYKGIVKSDEIITLMSLREMKYVSMNPVPFLWIGKGYDNFSWDNPLEIKQEKIFHEIRKKVLTSF